MYWGRPRLDLVTKHSVISTLQYCHTLFSGGYGAHPIVSLISKVSVIRTLTNIKDSPQLD